MIKGNRFAFRLGCVIVGLLLCAWMTAARAGKAVADGNDGYGNSKNTAGATTALFVSTYTGGPAENTRTYNTNTTNQFFATTTRTAGVDNPMTFTFNNAAPGTALNAAFVGGPFSTILGKNNLSKPTVARNDDGPGATGTVTYGLHSGSDPYSAFAGNDSKGIFASADKTAVNKVAGAAGSIAYDPFTLNSSFGPTYAYMPTLNGSLQLDDETESGKIFFFATDGFVYPFVDANNNLDKFVEVGQPMDKTLWTLTIQANGPISSLSDLTITFNLNPLAVQELNLSTTPGYSASFNASQLAALINDNVDFALANGGIMIANDGTASLVNFSPFALGTTFTPALGSSEEIANGNGASISAVPEPASLALLAAGCLGLLGCGRRKVLNPAGADRDLHRPADRGSDHSQREGLELAHELEPTLLQTLLPRADRVIE